VDRISGGLNSGDPLYAVILDGGPFDGEVVGTSLPFSQVRLAHTLSGDIEVTEVYALTGLTRDHADYDRPLPMMRYARSEFWSPRDT
jgi:hypothetical protein